MAIDLKAMREELAKEKPYMNKTLVPGEQVCTINEITWKKNDYNNQNGINVTLHLEGEDLTEKGFEGFFIDKNNELLGRHKGAVSKVGLSQYTYKDSIIKKKGKPDLPVDRDTSIATDFFKLASLCGVEMELFEGDIEDITVFIEKADKLISGKTLRFVIGGKEYERNGFIQYELYVAKAPFGFTSMEKVETEKKDSTLVPFNKLTMITRKAPVAPVPEFEPAPVEFDIPSSL